MMVELFDAGRSGRSEHPLRAQALEVGRLVAQLGQDGFAVLAPLGGAPAVTSAGVRDSTTGWVMTVTS